ncbi:hypothetical protein HMPREF3223_00230 [Cutibacterium avidum]|nr:hypothetical protein HMPREF3223_00230 [Cutibacterium avidum]
MHNDGRIPPSVRRRAGRNAHRLDEVGGQNIAWISAASNLTSFVK